MVVIFTGSQSLLIQGRFQLVLKCGMKSKRRAGVAIPSDSGQVSTMKIDLVTNRGKGYDPVAIPSDSGQVSTRGWFGERIDEFRSRNPF